MHTGPEHDPWCVRSFLRVYQQKQWKKTIFFCWILIQVLMILSTLSLMRQQYLKWPTRPREILRHSRANNWWSSDGWYFNLTARLHFTLYYVTSAFAPLSPPSPKAVRILKTENRYNANFVVTVSSMGCLYDNRRCHQSRMTKMASWRLLVFGEVASKSLCTEHWRVSLHFCKENIACINKAHPHPPYAHTNRDHNKSVCVAANAKN